MRVKLTPLYRNRIILCLSLLPIVSAAQLQVDITQSPEYIVQNHLLGEGVDLLNVSFNGASGSTNNPQIGTFSNGFEAIGISNGIVLATGLATIAQGPNDLPTAFEPINEDDQLSEEPDLAELMTGSAELNDVAVLEFDFIASGDTLRFSYVFASEEYNEHTCSPYNDLFGFFISGPGISGDGTFSNNAVNLATIPGRDVPVAINTVNRGTAGEYGSMAICNGADINWQENSQYFVDNELNTSLNTTQFDGFTKVFTVAIPVECGGTYHIKMAIADAVDGKNDSAVFLKSGSFASQAPLEVSVEAENEIEGEAIEGCSNYAFELSRNDSSATKVVYLKSAFADANPEIFPDFPDSLVFYPMQGKLNWELPVQHDGIFEGERSFEIAFLQPEICGLDTAETEFSLSITDRPELSVQYDDSLLVSCDELGVVNLELSGGLPPYTVDWEGGYSGTQFEIEGSETLEIIGRVSDQCGLHQENVAIVYDPIEYDPVQITVPQSVEINCLEPLIVDPFIVGGRGDYSHRWFFDTSQISTSSELNVNSPSEGEISLIVDDGCMPSDTAYISLELQDNPISVDLGDDRNGTCTESITLTPQVEGGFGELSFEWKRNLAVESYSSSFSFTPISPSLISLEVNDECEQSGYDTLKVLLDYQSIQITMPEDTSICKGERLEYTPSVKGGMGEYSYFWQERGSELLPLNVIPSRDDTYTLTVTDDCLQTNEAKMHVELVEVIADFDFDYDTEETPLINLSTPDMSYFWVLPSGETSTFFEPQFEPVIDKDQIITLDVTHPIGCSDSHIGFYEPPLNVFIPSAFTPDGDGLNDVFKVVGTYIDKFDLWVYDRWGNLVFHTNDLEKGWDGSDENPNFTTENLIYSYRVVAKGYNFQVFDKKGSVTVIR
jgi:gliding motility-associated-like protein